MTTTGVDSRRLAQMIVADSLSYSFRKDGGGNAEIEMSLDRLRTLEGIELTQCMLDEYLGAGTGRAPAQLDLRIIDLCFPSKPININASELREHMGTELEHSLKFSDAEREKYVKEYAGVG